MGEVGESLFSPESATDQFHKNCIIRDVSSGK
jgi:hypothetical protein